MCAPAPLLYLSAVGPGTPGLTLEPGLHQHGLIFASSDQDLGKMDGIVFASACAMPCCALTCHALHVTPYVFCRAHQRCCHLAQWGNFPSLALGGERGLRCYVTGGEQVSTQGYKHAACRACRRAPCQLLQVLAVLSCWVYQGILHRCNFLM